MHHPLPRRRALNGASAGGMTGAGPGRSGRDGTPRPARAALSYDTSCDILVVGGGPAGLVAAREAACANPALEIVLLERDRTIGAPVRCGEGVGGQGLEEFMDPAGAPWVSRR